MTQAPSVAAPSKLETSSVRFHIATIGQSLSSQEAALRFEYVRGYLDALYGQCKFDEQERDSLLAEAKAVKEAWPQKVPAAPTN